jgi:hypothetical protein
MPTTTLAQTTITATGTTNVTTPAYLTSAVIEVWGAGGRGGARTTTGGGGGGQGGGYSASTLTNLTQLTSYAFVVGAGSISVALGEDTTFATTTVVAKGGASCGNNVDTGANSVDNATAGTGTTKHTGGTGGLGLAGTGGGGGGESANTGSTGATGTAAASGGAGGTGGNGGDGGAGKQAPQGNGSPGVQPGGGGGGGYRTSSGTRDGGAGGAGQARYQFTVDRKDFMTLLGCG